MSGVCHEKSRACGVFMPPKPLLENGASGRTRTCNLLIRSQKLYPIELRTRWRVLRGRPARQAFLPVRHERPAISKARTPSGRGSVQCACTPAPRPPAPGRHDTLPNLMLRTLTGAVLKSNHGRHITAGESRWDGRGSPPGRRQPQAAGSDGHPRCCPGRGRT